MNLTLWNWIGVLALFGCLLFIGLLLAFSSDELNMRNILTATLIPIGIAAALALFLNWYNTNTASGIRAYKDFQSEMSNGIDREIIITAEDGREIFYYEGKVDVESNHEDNYIKFEGEDGRRYIIYYGIQDTIKIVEKK